MDVLILLADIWDWEYCRWVAINIFRRAALDLRLGDEDARAFLLSEGAAWLAEELGYGTNAPARLVRKWKAD